MPKRYKIFLLLVVVISVGLALLNYYSLPKMAVKIVPYKNASKLQPVHIILNTIPKSASLYITTTLQTGLNATFYHVANGYFPHDYLSYAEMERFYNAQAAIAKTHLDASLKNQQLLRKFTNRVLVHFRDPREVLLSWTHYLQHLHNAKKLKYLYYVMPKPPDAYFQWPLATQIDWNIEHYLPEIVSWMQGWVNFYDQNMLTQDDFRILITTYDDFRKDERGFYRMILDFYGIPEKQFKYTKIKQDMDLHFRRADQSEWETVFSDEQKQRISRMIPKDLLIRFKWKQ